MKQQRIVLLGPQGSGKGTQAAALSAAMRLPHISTGEMFRQHLKHRTPLGRKVAALLDAGKLVPDQLTNAIVRDRLAKSDARRGYILDGFPRTLPQAKFLQRLARPTVVLALELSDKEAIVRLGGRRMAPDGTIYHIVFNPAPKSLRRKLQIRDDDRPAAVRQRLRLYRRQTSPLLTYYGRQGVLHRIDARPSIKIITAQLKKIVTGK